jgi:hypothetical protein
MVFWAKETNSRRTYKAASRRGVKPHDSSKLPGKGRDCCFDKLIYFSLFIHPIKRNLKRESLIKIGPMLLPVTERPTSRPPTGTSLNDSVASGTRYFCFLDFRELSGTEAADRVEVSKDGLGLRIRDGGRNAPRP